MEFSADPAQVRPGLKGNLLLSAYADRPLPPTRNSNLEAARRRQPLGLLPAIPFVIVEPE